MFLYEPQLNAICSMSPGSEYAVNSDLLLFLVKVAGLPSGWIVPTAGWLIILS